MTAWNVATHLSVRTDITTPPTGCMLFRRSHAGVYGPPSFPTMLLQVKKHIADLPHVLLGFDMTKPNEPTRLCSGVSPCITSTDHLRLVRLSRVSERDTVRESPGNSKESTGFDYPAGHIIPNFQWPLVAARLFIDRIKIRREKRGTITNPQIRPSGIISSTGEHRSHRSTEKMRRLVPCR
jgi:hypothetical protein